jgi:Ca2+-binding RTX toxin-like protein
LYTTRRIGSSGIIRGDAAMLVFGTWMDEVLTGTREADALEGRDGDDELYGRRGADELDGGAGADLMVGGTGEDTYWVDDAEDRVRERAYQGFTDLVYSTASHRLFANVENLVLLGTADLSGTGNDLANIIVGNEGSNRLDGGAGRDHLEGGAGDDSYFVDSDDTVVEFAGGGLDTVRIFGTGSFSLSANVERAIVMESSVPMVTGNELDNVLIGTEGQQNLDGDAGNDRLFGENGDDVLFGRDGDDRLEGGQGNDSLRGGTGTDRLIGEDGNDVLRGDAGEDDLAGGEGNDSLLGGAGIDHLSGADGDDSLQGEAGDDRLEGADGNDRLDGGSGTDRLYGGAGRDQFYARDGALDQIFLDHFDPTATAATVDRMETFDLGIDKIGLDNDVFTGLGREGRLPSRAFAHGPASTPEHRILRINSDIYYDPDGVGGEAAVLILDGDSDLRLVTHLDFFIF